MTDIEISQKAHLKSINEIADIIGIKDNIEQYGSNKAKIKFTDIKNTKKGKLVLVTSINPTPYGEGKTTMSIGLNDGLRYIGKNSVAVLREPSLGPVFGIKGGATGGGYSQVVPMEDINLHFTGDFHAITTANNLISAAIDNHIYFGNKLNIDTNRIYFRRCLDMNDRALREVTLNNRKENFNITAASEIMSILCLSKDYEDLKRRLSNILLAFSTSNKQIYAKDLNLEGSLLTILKDALKPNLVQRLENNPIIIHGGPFANIAHGCNSIIATNLGLKLADYVITEAGFGSDLGAEKFFDIKCRKAKLKPNAVVIVATIRALKYNGYSNDIEKEDLQALNKVISNLEVHIENMLKYTSNIIVCLNKFKTDTPKEIKLVKDLVDSKGILFASSTSYTDGGKGAKDLAQKVVELVENKNDFKLLYKDELTVKEKIETISKNIYHTTSITYTDSALKKIKEIESLGYSNYPICIAKTQYSISDNPKLLGYPKDFPITIKDINIYTGAEFIVAYLGDIMTMPGLPRVPNYEKIDMNNKGIIKGLF